MKAHPKTTLFVFVLFFLLLVDFLSAVFFIPTNYNSYRCPSAWYHHDLLPMQHAKSIWGQKQYEVFTNSLGFKDASCREVSLTGPKNKRRIVLMGDSFTEGIGMDWEDSFAGILSKNNPDKEFLNAAVVSYSPKLYYLKTKYLLENVGLKFDEMIVFIDNSDPLNEIAYEHFKEYDKQGWKKTRIALQQYFYAHSYIYYSISSFYLKSQRNRVTDSWARILGEAFIDEVESKNNAFLAHMPDWSYQHEAYEKWGRQGLQLCKRNMEKLDALCKRNQIRLRLVIYPWPSIIKQNKPDNIQVSFWENFAAAHHCDFINLYPLFINGRNPDSVRKQYFIPGDVHWNKKGHQLIAEKIQSYFDEY